MLPVELMSLETRSILCCQQSNQPIRYLDTTAKELRLKKEINLVGLMYVPRILRSGVVEWTIGGLLACSKSPLTVKHLSAHLHEVYFQASTRQPP